MQLFSCTTSPFPQAAYPEDDTYETKYLDLHKKCYEEIENEIKNPEYSDKWLEIRELKYI